MKSTNLYLRLLRAAKLAFLHVYDLFKSKGDSRCNTEYITMAEEDSPVTGIHGMAIPQGSICREVLREHQGRYFVQLLMVKDDGVDPKVSV